MFHWNFFSVYKEHFEISGLHLTENNDKLEDRNRNILGGKFSKNLMAAGDCLLWPERMTIYRKQNYKFD